MKDIKTTYFTFEPYECLAVEEYLEMMAKQGWLLDSINRPFFRFKRIESKNLKFYVDIPNVREDRLVDYIEYCKAAGWKYLCKIESNFIFYTKDNGKTIDIHTDQNEKFRVVFKSSLQNIILQIIILLLYTINLYMNLFVLRPDDLLTSNIAIVTFLIMGSAAISSAIKVINFFLWIVKARKNLVKNEFMLYNSYRQLKIKNILSKFSSFTIIILYFLVLINENIHNTRALSIFFISLLMFAVIMGIIIYLFNSKKYYKYSNGILILGISLVFIYSITVMIYLLTVPTFERLGRLKEVEINLKGEDFGYKENENLYKENEKSIIAEKLYYAYHDDNENRLSYTSLKSNYSIAIKFQELRVVKKLKSYGRDLELKKTELPSDVKVYIDDEKKSYVVVSEDRVIDIRKEMDNIDEDEFLEKIYEKLILE